MKNQLGINLKSTVAYDERSLFQQLSMMTEIKDRFESQSYELLQYRILKLKYRKLMKRHQLLKLRYKHLKQKNRKLSYRLKSRLTAMMVGQLSTSHHHVKDSLALIARDISRFRCIITQCICHPRDVSYVTEYQTLPDHYVYFTKSSLLKLSRAQQLKLRILDKNIVDFHPRALMNRYQSFIEKICRIQKIYVDQLWFNRKKDMLAFIDFMVTYSKELNDPKMDIYVLKLLAHWGHRRAIQILSQQLLTGVNQKYYIGQHRNQILHGQGCLRLGNQFKYNGFFQFGKCHGYGHLFFKDGRKYSGQFKYGKYHGAGSFVYPDGRKLTGQFVAGRPTPSAVIHLPNGHSMPISRYFTA